LVVIARKKTLHPIPNWKAKVLSGDDTMSEGMGE